MKGRDDGNISQIQRQIAKSLKRAKFSPALGPAAQRSLLASTEKKSGLCGVAVEQSSGATDLSN